MRALPAPPKEPKRWPWIVGVIVVGVIGAAGSLWWLLDSTVPESDYDEVVAELATSDEALAAAQADAAALEGDLDALRAETEELSAALTARTVQAVGLDALAESLQSQLDAAMTSANFNGYFALNWFPEDVAAMQEVGVDTATADALLQELGENEAWTEWVETESVWLMQDRTLAEIDDVVVVLGSAWRAAIWTREVGRRRRGRP